MPPKKLMNGGRHDATGSRNASHLPDHLLYLWENIQRECRNGGIE